MGDVSKNTESQYLLNGIPQNAPLSWEDVTIEAEYPNDSVQPSLTITSFDFNLEARKAVNKWITDGTSSGVGIFEGMPLDLNLFNNNPLTRNFNAFIDFTNDYRDFPDDGEVTISIIKKDGLDNLFAQMSGTTYGYLAAIGVFTVGDYINVPYVVEKKFNLFELLMASVVLFLMVKELAESIEKLANAIADVSGLLLFIGVGSTALGAALLAVLKAILIAAYVAVLILAIIDLSKTLFEILVPPKRNHKAILLKTALEKVANHFGYQFVAPITEYNSVYYLPSNPNLDDKKLSGLISSTKGTQQGIPDKLDYGYFTEDMFTLAKNLPYAKMAVIGNTIHLRPKNDPFWVQQTQWQMPDVLINTLQYNTEDLKATVLLTFAVDLNDEWTIDNYIGTSVEIKTQPVVVINKKAVLLKGLDEVKFNVALGNRKDKLNAIEEALKSLGSFIDTVTGVFGGGTDFASAMDSKKGVLKQTSNWHSIPKLLYLQGGKLPINHRLFWNANLLWEKYHKEKSFVRDNWRGQKKVYRDVKIPFGYEDFLQLSSNPYFKFNGKDAKMISWKWTVGEDEAIVNFWVREPYTFNLKETKIIPS